MSFGIKISKPSYSVQTAEPKDLGLSSEYSLFKIKNSGSFQLIVSGGSGSTVIPHNLNYVPSVLVYCETAPGNGKRSRLSFESHYINQIYAKVDSINLTITTGSIANGTYNGYYYIFHDPIE